MPNPHRKHNPAETMNKKIKPPRGVDPRVVQDLAKEQARLEKAVAKNLKQDEEEHNENKKGN